MSLFGRDAVPGELDPYDDTNPAHVFNKTILAQVATVDPTNGAMTVNYESLPSGNKNVTVPPMWMSFPPSAATGGPAWGRYMPQVGDLVRVSFDQNHNPYIVGYDIVAGRAGVADGRSGWPALNDQYKSAQTSSEPRRAKFAQFTPLKGGEYDFMSSGGAYIYGSDKGRLYLAGGTVSVTLIKNELRLNSRAQLFEYIADDCDFRFGQARRSTGGATEAAVGSGALKELSVVLKNTVGGQALPTASLKLGNTIDDSGNNITNTDSGEETRYWLQVYNDAQTAIAKMGFDKLGNFEIISQTTNKGLFFDFTSSNWRSKARTIDFTASSEYVIDSPSISLGRGATEPIVLGNIYASAEKQYATGTAASISNLATQLSLLAAQVGVLGTTLGLTAVTTAAATIAAAATAIGTTATSTATTFTSAYGTYLSSISKSK